MKLDDGRLTFVAQQEVTALDAIHKAVLGKAACAGRVTEGVGTCISIHAPTWGATSIASGRWSDIIFQSTHPRGVRLNCRVWTRDTDRFQSTHPRGVRLPTRAVLTFPTNFNPRTHVGCDISALLSSNYGTDFNPRTHVGCDAFHAFFRPHMHRFQSTHPRGVRRKINFLVANS